MSGEPERDREPAVRAISEIAADWQRIEQGISAVSDWLRARFGRAYEIGPDHQEFLWRVHRPAGPAFQLRMTTAVLRGDAVWIEAQLEWIARHARTGAPIEPGHYHVSPEGTAVVPREW